MTSPISREIALIDVIERRIGGSDSERRLGDDTWLENGLNRLYTTDMLIEGHHFDRRYCTAGDVGWKAAAVNISDIAAMGGRLLYLLVSIGLPEGISDAWVDELYTGLQSAVETYNGMIIGGDTVCADKLIINVTAIGDCPTRHAPGYRHNAQTGDILATTGFHGLSHIGLLALQRDEAGYMEAKERHRRPVPCLSEGLALSDRYTRYALMDTSDGLADAAIKMAQASGLAFVLDAASLPIHPEVASYVACHSDIPLLETLLYGGEDFELLAALPADTGLPKGFTQVGRVQAAGNMPSVGAWLQNGEESLLPLSMAKTYQHFREPKSGKANHGQ